MEQDEWPAMILMSFLALLIIGASIWEWRRSKDPVKTMIKDL